MIVGDLNCRLRVLVIDPLPSRRERLIIKVRQQFTDVFVAEGDGPTLFDDAQRKVARLRCQAAVVVVAPPLPANLDAYLNDLAARLTPAQLVICSTRIDDRLAFQSGRHGMEYVRFGDPASDLCAAIEAQGRRGCRCSLAVSWPSDNFCGDVARSLRLPPQEIALDHLYDLMGRTFPQAMALDLRPLPSSQTDGSIDAAVRRALVLWASEQQALGGGQRIPKVVKIGPRGRIEREAQNYALYVDGWLAQNRQARLEKHVLLWDIGAIVYAFLGVAPDDIASFRHFYLDSEDPDGVIDVLRRLFTDTCRRWYWHERQQIDNTRLFDLYAQRLEIEERLARLGALPPVLAFPGVMMPLPNPAYWVMDAGMETHFDQVTTCIGHGDLHADNIFVDQSGVAWLIDFEQTGPAHALCDFVELEADIKLRLTPIPEDNLAALALLERSLLAGQTLSTVLIPPPEIAADPDLSKAFQVITGLRHLALIATGVASLREYLHALLYETLFMATLSRLSDAVHRRALLSAALIVERLMHLPEN